jgi:iron-sulfur cluster assembly protein
MMDVMEPPVSAGVKLTDEAVRQAKRWVERQQDPAAFLRMGLRGGGCSGFSYVLEIDNELEPDDHVFEFDGLKVIVDPRSMRYLVGTVLEYTGNLMTGGFEFRNPNAKKGCGCGMSFSV